MYDSSKVTGLMSGSSLDGVDLAFCEFRKDEHGWDSRIIFTETIPYPEHLLLMLGENIEWTPDRLHEADEILGTYFAEIINDFHTRNGVVPDLISSHGHTLIHQPERGITFQAGNGAIIAQRTGLRVINDFRRQDVEQGGQGAPLVPVGDKILFRDYEACINLGGFANISFDNAQNARIAFDVGPVNLALNHLARLSGMDYDKDGGMAASGRINQALLNKLNSIAFYKIPPPKSLGKEWFRETFLPFLERSDLSIPDRMATCAEHIAIQLSSAVALACSGSVLVTGGGALNKHLMDRFRFNSRAEIHIPSNEIIQYKEALIFAFLGLLGLRGEINCLSSASGGATDLSCGTIHQPKSIKQ